MGENTTAKPEIVVVDDSRVIRHAAAKMLGDDYTVHVAENGLAGWQLLQQNDAISVAFVDMQMPEMNGMELLTRIRSADNERLAALPVIIITGADDSENTKKQIFEAGATDFITKPFESIDLISRAKSYAHLNRKVVELEKKTSHDKITGLFSAVAFGEHGAKALSFALRHNLHLSMVSLEIVGFQDIYLSHGKRVAQQIIITIAKRLGEVMREEDIAARTGVARYALLLPLTNEASARTVVGRVRESVNKLLFDTGSEKLRIRLASGLVATAPVEGQVFSDIMAQADAALARAIRLNQVEAVQTPPAAPKPVITEALVNEALQYIIAGDFSRIPDYMLSPVAERLSPFLEYVNSRAGQRLASVSGARERE